MCLATVLLLLLDITNSHQDETVGILTLIEPTETNWIADFDSDLYFGVLATEEFTYDPSWSDTTATSSSIFTYTDNTETDEYDVVDDANISSSPTTLTELESTVYDTTPGNDSDSDSKDPLVDTPSAPIETTYAPIDSTFTPTTKRTTPLTTTKSSIIKTTTSPGVTNSTNNITASIGVGDNESNTSAIVGAVIGSIAGASGVVAIAILAWRYQKRSKLESKDDSSPGFKDTAPSSQRRPNTYIIGMSPNVRNERTTSGVYSNTMEVNELNTLKVTKKNVNTSTDSGGSDGIYNNTELESTDNTEDVHINTDEPLVKVNYKLSRCAGGPSKLENDEEIHNNSGVRDIQLKDTSGLWNLENDDLYIYSGESLEEGNYVLYDIIDGSLHAKNEGEMNSWTLKNDDMYETADVLSNIDNSGILKNDSGDLGTDNGELYETPNRPINIENEDVYESYDGAANTETCSQSFGHNDISHKTVQEKARQSTDSVYINAPKGLPSKSTRRNVMPLMTEGISYHGNCYKSPREVVGFMNKKQTKADVIQEDGGYVNMKSINMLRDIRTLVAEDDIHMASEGRHGLVNDAILDEVYNNTAQTNN